MSSKAKFVSYSVFLLMACSFLADAQSDLPIRVGMIGLDTSHVIAFARILNDPSDPEHVPGARVVAGFPGGSPDVEASRTRVDRFTAELRDKWGVEIVNDIPTLCSKVDAVLLESVDGRVHLEQVRPVFAAKKRVFIDKPLAASLSDALEIDRLAKEAGVPYFSSSSLRFHPPIQRMRKDPEIGAIMGCDAFSPAPIEPHHPDLFWYGIHGVEMLFTIMGPGCEAVMRMHAEGADLVVGRWKDGRIGTFRGIRKGLSSYGVTVFGEKAIKQSEPYKGSYKPLVEEIVKFFRTGVPPVRPEETLEIIAFMEAAEISKMRGGSPVSLRQIMP